jgi:hypothetical protein
MRNIIKTGLLALLACEKNKFQITERNFPEGKAQVKIGFFQAWTIQPTTHLYINDARVSSTVTAPISFPGGGFNMGGSSNGDYLQIDPGNIKIQGFSVFAGTPNTIAKLFENSQIYEGNKRYTLFVTDTAASTQTFAVEDDAVAPDSGFARVRFVNALPNLPAVDLYKGANATTATILIPNIAYKAATTWQDVQAPAGDSFFIRPAGAPITATPVARRSFTFGNRRIYTMLCRGYNGQTSTNLAPNISMIVNQ